MDLTDATIWEEKLVASLAFAGDLSKERMANPAVRHGFVFFNTDHVNLKSQSKEVPSENDSVHGKINRFTFFDE
jgi:hypothetical protein